jgi:hypothetical protein
MSEDMDRAVEAARQFLGERPAPDLTGAVMRGIEGCEPLASPRNMGPFRRLVHTLWAPREVSIRPAFALAAAAVLVAALTLPDIGGPVQEEPATTADAHVFVQFRLDAAASRVQLAGSFTNWEPRYELRQSVPGIWTITLPLTQGVHDYAFVVDGTRWMADPYTPQIGDGFGGTNNRLALLSPDTPQL